ncbi:MAG: glycosyltransferase family A protein [Tunicatimonas sp.]|uniref:glycosyltransferase family 2 protein n=1 Tax=Tunicatimonas sp. TaxID=1940096 RepID=UPI003C733F65
MPLPKVSVSIITYNHEKYIERTILSVLKQRANFDYEIIIGDDYSTDGTREILQTYQQQYPDIIQLVLHPQRYEGVPGRLNNITNLYACRGQYVAMLDGDDYWISEGKLQTQVDFLDQHPDYVLTFHDAKVVSEDNESDTYYYSEKKQNPHQGTTFTQEQVAKKWFIQTSTMLFRNHLIGEFPDWFWQICSADHAIQLLITRYGKAKYLNNLESVRWVHSHSFNNTYWRDKLIQNELMISDLLIFSENFPALRWAIQSDHILARRYSYSAQLFWQRNRYKDALVSFFKCISQDPSWVKKRIKVRMQLLFSWFLPAFSKRRKSKHISGNTFADRHSMN